MSAATSFAEFYHEETKYSPEGLQRHQHELDWTKEPFPFKQYTKGKPFDLTVYLPDDTDSFTDDAVGDYVGLPRVERELAYLSRLLYFTNGVTAVVRRINQRPFLMRAAPSAGGLYPTEIYVATRDFPGLPDGLYNYQVANHSLIQFWEGEAWPALAEACFNHDALATTNAALLFTAEFYRSAWRYQDRAYRRIFLDTGHIIGNVTAALPLFGRTLYPIGGFADDKLNDLLFLPRGLEEVIAVAALAPAGTPPEAVTAPSALPSSRLRTSHRVPPGARMLALHDASKIEEPPVCEQLPEAPPALDEPGAPPAVPLTGDKYAFTFGEAIGGPLLDWHGRIGLTILRRRSTRAYSGEPLTREELGTLFDFTYHPELYPPAACVGQPRYFDAGLLQTFLAINGVTGVDEGCYYYAPHKRELHQIRFKNFRQEVHYLCLGQRLGLDAAAVVFHTADLPRAVELYGERAYRYLHLDAGHLGHRLNLAAVRMGLGASGIGGFFDDQVNELLGIPEREAVVYITTLGRPATES